MSIFLGIFICLICPILFIGQLILFGLILNLNNISKKMFRRVLGAIKYQTVIIWDNLIFQNSNLDIDAVFLTRDEFPNTTAAKLS